MHPAPGLSREAGRASRASGRGPNDRAPRALRATSHPPGTCLCVPQLLSRRELAPLQGGCVPPRHTPWKRRRSARVACPVGNGAGFIVSLPPTLSPARLAREARSSLNVPVLSPGVACCGLSSPPLDIRPLYSLSCGGSVLPPLCPLIARCHAREAAQSVALVARGLALDGPACPGQAGHARRRPRPGEVLVGPGSLCPTQHRPALPGGNRHS
jgi:hypothetical protein